MNTVFNKLSEGSELIIERVDGNLTGICTYRLKKNDVTITTFQHDRLQGMEICLLKAAEAVSRVDWDKLYNELGGL